MSEEYPTLHHYTDAGGLKGILENNELWATHYKFLNDFTELTRSRDIILPHVIRVATERFTWWNDNPEMAKVVARGGGYETVVSQQATSLVDAMIKATVNSAPPYFVSFASPDVREEQLNGSLDLWRAYSKDSQGGYCLVFDTKALEELTAEEVRHYSYHLLHMADVTYTATDLTQLERLSKLVTDVLNGFVETLNWPIQGEKIDASELFEPGDVELTRHKSPYFRNEREVRVVASPITRKSAPSSDRKSREVFHRVSGGCLVPTMRLFGRDVSSLPIRQIIVGPSDRQDQRIDGLRSFVESKGREIEVVPSNISYRAM